MRAWYVVVFVYYANKAKLQRIIHYPFAGEFKELHPVAFSKPIWV